MSELPLYGNPSKRDLIERAYEEMGMAGYEFEISPEEDASALRKLQSMMAELEENENISLGFYFVENGYGSVADPSGIPAGAVNAIATLLGFRLAPSQGKAMAGESKAALSRAMTLLRGKYTTIPSMMLGRQTIRGAGSRWGRGWYGPFFFTPTPDDEVQQ